MLLNPIQSRALFAHALQNKYAILAVNADSPAAITDCLEAARRCNAPIIIETSLWQLTGWSFGAGDPFVGLARYLVQIAALANSDRYLNVPVILHTDHIKGPQTLDILTQAVRGLPVTMGGQTLALSPSTISLDSSELSEEENIQLISVLCRESQETGRPVTLEMEAGVDDGLTPAEVTRRLLGGVEALHPGQVWLWAPGLGTKHGFSDSGYPAFSVDAVAAQRALAHEITGRPIGIALHGSSGLSELSLREAVQAGVVKVNWSTESLIIRSRAAAEYYDRHREQLQPKHPDFKATAMDNGVQTTVSAAYIPKLMERIELLGAGVLSQGALQAAQAPGQRLHTHTRG